MGGVIGVDEAGRGPVLGSLFAAALAAPDRPCLPDGVADSKQLEPDVRRTLATRLERADEIEHSIVEIGAAEIDATSHSLTVLVAEAFASAIDMLDPDGATIVVDTGEANTDRFAHRVEQAADTTTAVRAAIGADRTDPVVSAASILAKEHRERHVARLRDRYGEVGSGYPSDPTTRSFLAGYVETHGELPACARRCWRTSRDVLAAAEQATFDGFIAGAGR